MYEMKKEIIGYVIKMKKTTIDMEKINLMDVEDVDLSSLYITYYIGVHGRKLMKIPQNKSSLFTTKENAVSHIKRFSKNDSGFVLTIDPVYKEDTKATKEEKKQKQCEMKEIIEFRKRTKKINYREDQFRNYAKQGKIVKLK